MDGRKMGIHERERLKAERRRARDEARKSRLLNAKYRLYGRDQAALDSQIADKVEREKAEMERDLAFDQKRVNEATTLNLIEKKLDEEKKLTAMQLAKYHKEQQHAKERRDAAELEYRRGLVDDSNTVFLHFHGEDMGAKERKKMQQRQQHKWIVDQLTEKDEARKRELDQEKKYVSFVQTVGGRVEGLEAEEEKEKMMKNMKIMEYNKKLEAAKRKKNKIRDLTRKKEEEEEFNYRDTSKFMNEDMMTTMRSDGTARHVPYHFKGFDENQRRKILEEQARQREEQARRKMMEKQEQQDYESQMEKYRVQLVKLERARAENRLVEEEQLRRYNEKQALEKKSRDKQIKTNVVDEAYFDQFGKSLY